MNKIFIPLTVVLVLAVAGVAVYAFMAMGERDDLQEELTSTLQELETTKTALTSTEADLSTTQDTLASAEADLDSSRLTLTTTRDELTTTQNELTTTRDELTSTQDELSEKENDLASKKAALSHAENRLSDAEEELEEVTAQYTVALETLQGLDITLSPSLFCFDVMLVDNPDAVNPTWAELKAFLAEDHTEQHEYVAHEYDCSEFSRDLHNHAEAAGIRCAEVHVMLVGEEVGHALNAFLTTDYGLVYVDCTGVPDKIARVKSGYEFRAVTVPAVSIQNVRNDAWWATLWSYYYFASGTGAHLKVSAITIYW